MKISRCLSIKNSAFTIVSRSKLDFENILISIIGRIEDPAMYRSLSIHVVRWTWYFIIRSVDSKNHVSTYFSPFDPLKKLLVSILYWKSKLFQLSWRLFVRRLRSWYHSNCSYLIWTLEVCLSNVIQISFLCKEWICIVWLLSRVSTTSLIWTYLSVIHSDRIFEFFWILWNFDFMCPWISFRFIS